MAQRFSWITNVRTSWFLYSKLIYGIHNHFIIPQCLQTTGSKVPFTIFVIVFCKKREENILWHQKECTGPCQPPRWAISKGNAGNKASVSSGFPAAMFVRHQAASSNCNITNRAE